MAASRWFTDFRRLNRSSATAMSHVRVIVRLRGVAVSASLGANMKIRRYRKPVILAFVRGERAAACVCSGEGLLSCCLIVCRPS
jgi:hypothetical protein